MKPSLLRPASLVLALASLAACGGGGSDDALIPNSPIPVPGGPANLHVADFDGDGLPDIAVTNSGEAGTNVLLGTGGGAFRFSSQSPFGLGTAPYALTGGKVNADGLEDLVVADWQNDKVYILLATAPGEYSPAAVPPLATGDQPYAVELADLNNDGSLDLVVTNIGDDTLTVLLGSPARDGTFTPWQTLIWPSGSQPTSVRSGDFNSDGLLDLAVCSATGPDLTIMLGNGNGWGTFLLPVTLPDQGVVLNMAVGDLDDDGILDLVLGYALRPEAGVFLGNGDGTFTESAPVSCAGGSLGVDLGDLDGDGVLDLVMSGGTVVSARLGDGFGGFAGSALGGDLEVGSGAADVRLVDVNLDGLLDVVTAVSGASVIDVHLGNGRGGFIEFVRPQ